MRGFAKVLAMISGLMLSGCYESTTDLIGDHAVPILRMDSVVLFRDSAYFGIADGTPTLTLCWLGLKSDMGRCQLPERVKMERLSSGDYLVQLNDALIPGNFYAIWHRSLIDPGNDPANDCILVLGEDHRTDYILFAALGMKGTPTIDPHESDPRLRQLRAALAPFAKLDLADRQTLLEIAKVYENTVFRLGDPACPGDRLHFGAHDMIRIKGDNRDLPPLE